MKKWTAEEVEILRKNYGIESHKNLCNILQNRTWCAIANKASYLKLVLPTSEERFWKYVNKGRSHECWNWSRHCNHDGYGKISIKDKIISTHRFSWELHFGKIPDGLLVCHTCDNPKCVNPRHLFLGTIADNNKDRDNKHRQFSKLTLDQVKEIRQLCRKRKIYQREIAKIFNVSCTTISHIHTNKRWK